MRYKLWPCLTALLICSSAFPQKNADTTFIITAKKHAISLHQQAMGSQSRLHNGSRYLEPDFTYEKHPFFLSVDWISGSVFYDGEYFESVPLMYDLLNEVLVAEHQPSGHAIQLIREKVGYFSLEGRYFERIKNESVNNSLPGTGFYEVIYNGASRIVARRQKVKHEKIETSEILFSYEDRNRYFILRNDVYFQIKSKASILKLMGSRKQELKKYLKEQGFRFSDDRERALRTIAQYYDTLK